MAEFSGGSLLLSCSAGIASLFGRFNSLFGCLGNLLDDPHDSKDLAASSRHPEGARTGFCQYFSRASGKRVLVLAAASPSTRAVGRYSGASTVDPKRAAGHNR